MIPIVVTVLVIAAVIIAFDTLRTRKILTPKVNVPELLAVRTAPAGAHPNPAVAVPVGAAPTSAVDIWRDVDTLLD